jgi:hypothetical protein
MKYPGELEKLVGSDLPRAALDLRDGGTGYFHFSRKRILAHSCLFPHFLDPESYFLINVHWIPPLMASY